ncbi:MAG: hypothetical protein Q8920_17500 [Bacillota bacterium]|nr:hypothetical protein [Bacillota bacterium]
MWYYFRVFILNVFCLALALMSIIISQNTYIIILGSVYSLLTLVSFIIKPVWEKAEKEDWDKIKLNPDNVMKFYRLYISVQIVTALIFIASCIFTSDFRSFIMGGKYIGHLR